ncbi:MAG TPA: TIR domain-containing protein [Anaerolineales bacterium]|nr:TIR domain-containing protein [Anaerolineales bacterium]
MPEVPRGHVFVSYSRRDREIMWRIVRFLREQGLNAWVDNEKLIPGTPIWEEEIEKAIKSASAAIVVMSPDAKSSEWVRREISLADQNRKQIFPVLVRGDEDSSITLRLITRQYVDLRANEEAGLRSLYAALSDYLNYVEPEASEEPSPVKPNPAQNAESVSPPVEMRKEAVGSAVIPIALAWAIAGAIGGVLYNATEIPAVGGAIGGALGGLATAFISNFAGTRSRPKQLAVFALAWAIGAATGWAIGNFITEPSGIAIGYAIGIAITMAIVTRVGQTHVSWKNIAWIVLAWSLGAALGWWIARRFLIDQLDLGYEIAWAIGTAIGWAIAGLVSAWQLLNSQSSYKQ